MDAEQTAGVILLVLAAYLSLGGPVALAFVFAGVHGVDPAAGRSSLAFRLLILPASIALWPWVLVLWLHSRRTERRG